MTTPNGVTIMQFFRSGRTKSHGAPKYAADGSLPEAASKAGYRLNVKGGVVDYER